MNRTFFFVVLLMLTACGSRTTASDAGTPDSGTSSVDAAPNDAGTETSVDAEVPGGDCLDLPTWTMPASAPSLSTPLQVVSDVVLPAPAPKPDGVISLIETGTQFAFSALGNFFVYDAAGTLAWSTHLDPFHSSTGQPVADTAGNYYLFVNDKLTSFTATGDVRWERAFPTSERGPTAFSYAPVVYKDETVLFLARPTNTLFALDAKTGTIRAQDAVGDQKSFGLVGIHHYVTDQLGHFWDAKTLERRNVLGRLDGQTFQPVAIAALPDGTLVGARKSDYHLFVFDRCFRIVRDLKSALTIGIELLDLKQRIWNRESGGFRLLETASSASPIFVSMESTAPRMGADGAVYASVFSKGTFRAYDANGQNVESLTVPVGDALSNALFHPDGTIDYLVWNNGLHRVRIQTKSPGAALTGMNVERGNNQQSGFPLYPGLP